MSHLELNILSAIQGMPAIWDVRYWEVSLCIVDVRIDLVIENAVLDLKQLAYFLPSLCTMSYSSVRFQVLRDLSIFP